MIEFRLGSNRLSSVVEREESMFRDIFESEDIPELIIVECRRVAIENFLTISQVENIINKIINNDSSVNANSLDEIFFQRVSVEHVKRFKAFVLNKKIDSLCNFVYDEILNLEGANILHLINSL